MRRLAAVVTALSIALVGCSDDGDTVPPAQSSSTRPEQVNEVEGDDEKPEPTEDAEGEG